MKLIGKIALILAGAILILHAIMPHQHHNELNEHQHFHAHESADSIFDYIQLAFHLNPGEDHLEDFQGVEFYQLFLSFYEVHSLFSFEQIVLIDHSFRVPLSEDFRCSLIPIFQLQFRGPPSI